MYESEKSRSTKKSAKNQGTRKRAKKIKEGESASAKVQKFRPKKEHKKVSAKSFA